MIFLSKTLQRLSRYLNKKNNHAPNSRLTITENLPVFEITEEVVNYPSFLKRDIILTEENFIDHYGATPIHHSTALTIPAGTPCTIIKVIGINKIPLDCIVTIDGMDEIEDPIRIGGEYLK